MVRTLLYTLTILVTLGAVACVNDEARIQDGSYAASFVGFDVDPAGEQELLALTLTVDRAQGIAVVHTGDSTSITLQLHFAPRSDWVSICPTNTSHTAAELATTDATAIDLGPVTFARPTLLASCGAGELSLVEGCEGDSGCLHEGRTILFRAAPQ